MVVVSLQHGGQVLLVLKVVVLELVLVVSYIYIYSNYSNCVNRNLFRRFFYNYITMIVWSPGEVEGLCCP